MASVFIYHVVGDLTVGKPELAEFYETETVEAAIKAIGESTECGIPVWKKRSLVGIENNEMRQQRFVGILNSFDIVSFLARAECLEDQDKATKTPVSEVVVPNNSLLRQVDPGTRLIDALEMMKQGVKRLLVRKSVMWKGMSKRFSILYNGKWLKNIDPSYSSGNNLIANTNRPSSSSTSSSRDKFCCLSREDVIRFLIGCLGALAPIPLSSISLLGAINPNYSSIEASLPAIEVTNKPPGDPSAIAVVEPTQDGQYKIIGEISASKLWKCDYLAAAWALANLSSGQFVMGVEDNMTPRSLPDYSVNSPVGENNTANGVGSPRPRKFCSRSIGFNPSSPSLGISRTSSFGMSRSMYRGRSAPLTCKITSSLAAVMAQMLSHRATHVWVTEDESDDVLVGVVGYADILTAVTKQPTALNLGNMGNRSYEGFATEIQS
ncbi:CBS domain-containing protein CBSX6 isoform X3 [Pistacia vera]|uniref:CBS domain-containing protein CBSX6 isoform X1 n=1 Tax=Pistacia vera TaxID=55513 RepID=UPI001263A89A|nr:CBS domain-containing protein CBSX6 isoform X1 [Pistacia vera]XP_031249787.1 CBS domain-containing protein CBSX6 isoform X2 [Pistacia vera]XP_031249788.1 CBS domain-containing protein CBSX6 isoform X3 [Pistacia vera]